MLFCSMDVESMDDLRKRNRRSSEVLNLLDRSYTSLFGGIHKGCNLGRCFTSNDVDICGMIESTKQIEVDHPLRLDLLLETSCFNTYFGDDGTEEGSVRRRKEIINRVYGKLKKGITFADINASCSYSSMLHSRHYLMNHLNIMDDLYILKEDPVVCWNRISSDEDTLQCSNVSTPLSKASCAQSSIDDSTSSVRSVFQVKNKSQPAQSPETPKTLNHVYPPLLPSSKTINNQLKNGPAPNPRARLVVKSRDKLHDPGTNESSYKRVKHNAMEKLRRRHVTQAFQNLGKVLDFGGGKKASKANILTGAKQTVMDLQEKLCVTDRNVKEVYSRRESLIATYLNLITQVGQMP